MSENVARIDSHDSWRPSHNPWLVCAAVMLATIIEVLDTTITNVALPHIAGNLAVSNHEATWVLTSYLVANAIILPTTAWFSGFFGRKNFLIACTIIFTISSLMCGLAGSMGFLLVARILQGLGGGALQPISQAILLESFPREKRGLAMAVFAMGVIVAPIIGPVIGGWLTDNYSWRWIFFINLPIGITSVMMTNLFVEDPPYIKKARTKIDTIGFFLMAVGLGTLQTILDKGQEVDWFSTPWLCWATGIMVVSLIVFVVWELHQAHPVVDLKILKDRNFSAGLIAVLVLGASMYSILTLLPLYFQTLMGYSAYLSGLVSSPLGIGAFCSAIIVGRFSGRMDGRVFFFLGMLMLGLACLSISNINLQIGMGSKTSSIIACGFAISMSFVPLTILATGGLSNKDMGNGSGLFNLMRNIGGSIGIAMVTTTLARMAQVHQAYMVRHLTPYNSLYQQAAQTAGSDMLNPLLYQQLLKQSALLAYIDCFRFFGSMALGCACIVFLFKKVSVKPGQAMAVH